MDGNKEALQHQKKVFPLQNEIGKTLQINPENARIFFWHLSGVKIEKSL